MTLALASEPEAVTRDEQDLLTQRARDAARRRQARVRTDTLGELKREHDYHQSMAVHLEREIAKLERKLQRTPVLSGR